MFTKKTGQHRNRNMLTGLVIGVAIGAMILFVGTAVVSGLILQDTLSTDVIGFAACTISFAAALLGSLFVSKFMGEKQLLCCGLFVLVFDILNLALGMLFFNGITSRIWVMIISIAAGAGSCCAVNMIPKKKKQYRFSRHG